jgi:hypothetical protein
MANASAIEAGRAFVRIFLRDDMAAALARTLNNAGKSLKSFGATTMKGGAGLMAGGGAVLAPIVAGIKAFAEMGGEAVDASARTGLSVEALSELGFAAEQTGASIGDVDVAMKALAKSGLARNGESAEQAFLRVADAIAKTEDSMKRAALAQQAFGRSGTKLLPMIGDLDALRAKARELGIVMSTDDAAAADDLGDAFDALKAQSKAVFFQIGAAVAGPLLKFAKQSQQIAGAVIAWVRENRTLVASVAAAGVALVAAGGAMVAIGAAISGAGVVLSTLGAIVGAVLSPVGLLTTALVGGAVAWFRFTESGQAAWTGIINGVLPALQSLQQTFGGVLTAIRNGNWANAGAIAMTGLELALLQGMDAISAIFGEWLGGIAKQLAMGDVKAAMQTAATGLYAVWAAWSEMVVNVFTGLGRKLTDAWEAAVNALSRKILETSAAGGVGGKVASWLLGVDMQKEQARENKMNAERQRLGMTTGGPADVTDEAARNAAAATKAKADAFRRQLDAVDAAASANTQDAAGDAVANVDAATAKANAKIEELKKRLDSLKSAEDFQAFMSDLKQMQADQGRAGAGGMVAAVKSSLALGPTFSAAAAQAAGQVGIAPQDRMAKAVEEQKGILADVKQAIDAGNALAQQSVTIYERFLAAMTYG